MPDNRTDARSSGNQPGICYRTGLVSSIGFGMPRVRARRTV
jgi:hypothetical protein